MTEETKPRKPRKRRKAPEAPAPEAPEALAPESPDPEPDAPARAFMLVEADALWHQIIEEPKRGEVSVWITEIFDACGWGSWLRGPHGGCPNGYTRPPDPDWCGLFVGYCGLQVGLDPKIAKSVLPSTYRLHNPKAWEKAGYAKPERPERLEPGDVVVVGDAKPWGTHIVLVAEVDFEAGSFVTFEGNARGLLRDGRTGKGVVKRTRSLDEALHVYRLSDECFHGSTATNS